MRFRYVTAINHLNIAGDLSRGNKLDDTTFITNNNTVIRALIDQRVISLMGTLEWSAIAESKTVIYGNYEITNNNLYPIPILNNILFRTKFFLHSLWLVLDNGADNDLGFLIYNVNGTPNLTSNFIATGISKADGTRGITEISREQLRCACSLYRQFDKENLAQVDYVTRLEKHSNRVERALYHIQSARHSSDLAIKLVNYCTAAESIFASSHVEMTHQLSERLACFLEHRGSRRVEAYKDFKRAYNFRSRITHGESIDPKQFDELKRLSVICDDFLRRAIRRLLYEVELGACFGSEQQLNDFFITTLLGADAH